MKKLLPVSFVFALTSGVILFSFFIFYNSPENSFYLNRSFNSIRLGDPVGEFFIGDHEFILFVEFWMNHIQDTSLTLLELHVNTIPKTKFDYNEPFDIQLNIKKFAINANDLEINYLFVDSYLSSTFKNSIVTIATNRTEQEYVFKSLNFDFSFDMDISSNSSMFSPDGSPILVSTIREISYNASLYIAKQSFFVTISFLLLLVLFIISYLILKQPFNPEARNANGDLIFRTILLPHSFTYLIVTIFVVAHGHIFGKFSIIFFTNFNEYYLSEPINLYLLSTYMFGLVGLYIIPIIIEISSKNYQYMGISTCIVLNLDHLKYAETKDHAPNVNKYNYPNTLKINPKSVSSQKMLNELLLKYENALFDLITIRTIISVIILSVCLFLFSSNTAIVYLILILYYYWIIKRRINPNIIQNRSNKIYNNRL